MTTDDDATALRLDRDHVFHSWSAQAHLSPLVIAGGLGSTVWDHAGRRYLDFSSQLVNTNIGHQHPRVVAAIQEQAATLTTVAPATANLTRGRAAERVLSHAPDGFTQRLLHQRRGRRQRERDPDGPPAHRPRQGGVGVPLVPRQHRRGRGRDGGLAAGAQRVRPRARAPLRPVPVPLGVLGDHARAGVRARAAPPGARDPGGGSDVGRGDPAGDHPRHRRACSSRRPATWPASARSPTGTASCSSSTRSWPGSAAPGSGSRSTRSTSSRTSSRSPRASTPATSPRAA